jgi:signal transduction histidine kinase
MHRPDRKCERRDQAAVLRDAVDQLRALTGHLQAVREAERTRIARQIHDELGQALTALKMDLAWLYGRLVKASREEWIPPLLAKAESMSELMDRTVQAVRQLATELRPGALDNLGLVAAVEWQAQDFQNRSGIRCLLATDPEDLDLDLDLDRDRSTVAFRILQEALTNVARHAGASEVHIFLKKDAATVTLEVVDNGRGITEEQITHAGSLGLLGMRERAALVGGEVQVTRLGERGTRVTLRLPGPGGLPDPAAHRNGVPSVNSETCPGQGQARAGPPSLGAPPAPGKQWIPV